MSQGQPSSGRKDLLSASSPPLQPRTTYECPQNWEALHFRFGAPLQELPCVYLGDCGNVPSFLVEAGNVIRKNLGTEGLFRKTGDLRRQKHLKNHVEAGGSLSDVDVHDVTSLVKCFFRLLPEPLVPWVFHDPLLACLEISPLDKRKEHVQDLCFALPAHHLSCLRYFIGLLAEVADMAHLNKMTPRNLAVVVTPSLIRIKSHSKLMSHRELRALPYQTALIEHLICNAASVGAMTSRTHSQSLRLLEDMSRKWKSEHRRGTGVKRKSPEAQLKSEKFLLSMVAYLKFRPNSCKTVPDSEVLSQPHAYIDDFLSWKSGNSSYDSELGFQMGENQRLPSWPLASCKSRQENKKVQSQRRILLRDIPFTRIYSVDRRAEPKKSYFRKGTFDQDLFPFGWTIGPALLESWSKAIPVMDVKGDVGHSSDWSDSSEDVSEKASTDNEETPFPCVHYRRASIPLSYTCDNGDGAVHSLEPILTEASNSVGKFSNMQSLNKGPVAIFDVKQDDRRNTVADESAQMVQDWLMKVSAAQTCSPQERDVSNSHKKSVGKSAETGNAVTSSEHFSRNDPNSESSADGGSKIQKTSSAISEVKEISATSPTLQKTSATPPMTPKSFPGASEMQKRPAAGFTMRKTSGALSVGKCLGSCPSVKCELHGLSCELLEQAVVSQNTPPPEDLAHFSQVPLEQEARKTSSAGQAKVFKRRSSQNFESSCASCKDATIPVLLLHCNTDVQPGPSPSDSWELSGMEFFHNPHNDGWERDETASPEEPASSYMEVCPNKSDDDSPVRSVNSLSSDADTENSIVPFHQLHVKRSRVRKCRSFERFPSRVQLLQSSSQTSEPPLDRGVLLDQAESASQLSKSKQGPKERDSEGHDHEGRARNASAYQALDTHADVRETAATGATENQIRTNRMKSSDQSTKSRISKRTVDPSRRSTITEVPVTACHVTSTKTGAESNRYIDRSSLNSATYGDVSKSSTGGQEEANIPICCDLGRLNSKTIVLRKSQHRRHICRASDLLSCGYQPRCGNVTPTGVCARPSIFEEGTPQNAALYEKRGTDLTRQPTSTSDQSCHTNSKLPVSRPVLSALPIKVQQVSGQIYPPTPKLPAQVSPSAPVGFFSRAGRGVCSKARNEHGSKLPIPPSLQSDQRVSHNMRNTPTETYADGTRCEGENVSLTGSRTSSETTDRSRPQRKVTFKYYGDSRTDHAVPSQLNCRRPQTQISSTIFGHHLPPGTRGESERPRCENEDHGKSESPEKDGENSSHKSAGDSILRSHPDLSHGTLEGVAGLVQVHKNDRGESAAFGRRARSLRRQTRAIYSPFSASSMKCFTSESALNSGEISDENRSSVRSASRCLSEDVEMSHERHQTVKISERHPEVAFEPAASSSKSETRNCKAKKRGTQLPPCNVHRSDKLEIIDIRKHVEQLSRAFESLEQELMLESCSSLDVDVGFRTQGKQISNRRNHPNTSQRLATESTERMSFPRSGNEGRTPEPTTGIRRSEHVYCDPPSSPLPRNTRSASTGSSAFVIRRQEGTMPPSRPLDESWNCQRQVLPPCLLRRNQIRDQRSWLVLGTIPGADAPDLNFNRNYNECMAKLESIRAVPRKAMFAPNGDIVLKFFTRSLCE